MQGVPADGTSAPANMSTALDWQPQRTRPKRLALAITALSAFQPGAIRQADAEVPETAHMLQSQRFSLTAGTEQQLRLVGHCSGKGREACQILLALSISCTAHTGRQPQASCCALDNAINGCRMC